MLLTQNEVMDMLKVDKITLWRWRRDGVLKAYKIGPKLIRFNSDDIDDMIKNSIDTVRKEE